LEVKAGHDPIVKYRRIAVIADGTTGATVKVLAAGGNPAAVIPVGRATENASVRADIAPVQNDDGAFTGGGRGSVGQVRHRGTGSPIDPVFRAEDVRRTP